jgi:hypothetical protein
MVLSVQELVAKKDSTWEEAAETFDTLPPVSTDFMIGTWKGEDIKGGSPGAYMLESLGWFGKTFESSDVAYPLVFYTKDKSSTFAAKHAKLAECVKNNIMPSDVQEEVEDKSPAARLRVVEWRGVSSAAMCYNEVPVIDHFRKVDEDTVYGMMDTPKGHPAYSTGPPRCFVLYRQK